jgi:hypothetical protein
MLILESMSDVSNRSANGKKEGGESIGQSLDKSPPTGRRGNRFKLLFDV